MNLIKIRNRLTSISNPERAGISKRFFKTGPGEYGEGDQFIGVRVSLLRILSKQYVNLYHNEIDILLASPIHEERLLALLILIQQYKTGDDVIKKRIYNLYLNRTEFINSWDLVDVTAEHIVGHYLLDKDKGPLYQLCASENLWERRISIISTFCLIKQNLFDDTLRISKRLLHDPHELIHKAVGWMLREIGKRNQGAEEAFLAAHYADMPRTMLRYAIEKFPEPLRQAYLKGAISR
ncbi:MAG: DNA alkylation repair protein [Desulfobacterales bacterium]|nr:DNA alkylation repair protein [Desulfobacterales bacterium]